MRVALLDDYQSVARRAKRVLNPEIRERRRRAA
jgi:hypothetical protein